MKRRISVLLALGLLLVLVSWAAWSVAWRRGLDDLQSGAAMRAERTAQSLKSTLDRYEYLPYLLSRHPFVVDLLAQPANPAMIDRANRYLADLNLHAHATAAYVIDANGVALASSNWNASDSFVGEHYLFRPYFRDALNGTVGRFFGIGTVKGDPGYYISQPIFDGAGRKVIGVAVIKLSLEWMQHAEDKEPLLVADDHGVIFLSSVPAWRYRALRPLPREIAADISTTRQYARQPIAPLRRTVLEHLGDNVELVRMPRDGRHATAYLATSRELGDPDWQLITLASLAPVREGARVAAFAAASAFSFLCVLLMYWRQRRSRVRDMVRSRGLLQQAYAELEQRVADRTADLSTANQALSTEVQERTRAEQELRAAQTALVEAGKLAALGRMAAGVTHELNQPLAALRSFSDNARVLLARQEYAVVGDNLEAIASLTERMGRITGQLKLFAGKVRPGASRASVVQGLRNTLMVLQARLDAVDLSIFTVGDGTRQPFDLAADGSVEVACDALRLEQVLINLLSNAIDAVAQLAAPAIQVEIAAWPDTVRIAVFDNGPGVAPDAREHLFEPFFTTKEGAQGLGLGLAISSSIAAEYGGSVAVLAPGPCAPLPGAAFALTLPRARVVGGGDPSRHDHV